MLRAWRTIKKAARMYSATKKLRLPSPMLDASNFAQKYMEERRMLVCSRDEEAEDAIVQGKVHLEMQPSVDEEADEECFSTLGTQGSDWIFECQ
jgi:hypothetical protein